MDDGDCRDAFQFATRCAALRHRLVADGLTEAEIFEVAQALLLFGLGQFNPLDRGLRAMGHISSVSNAVIVMSGAKTQ